jgi:hypothetical protein
MNLEVEPASLWFPLLDDECDPTTTATTCKERRCCYSQRQKIRGEKAIPEKSLRVFIVIELGVSLCLWD